MNMAEYAASMNMAEYAASMNMDEYAASLQSAAGKNWRIFEWDQT